MQLRRSMNLTCFVSSVLVLLSHAPAVHAVLVDPRLRASGAKKADVTSSQVDALRTKLARVADGLESTVHPSSGTLANTQVGPMVKLFLKELRDVLNASRTDKNMTSAWSKLQAAQASIAGLGRELEARQESLMKEDADQKESLLLGVLMARKGESMKEQLKVLDSEAFAELPVAVALKRNHTSNKPLFEQAASYLDQHQHGSLVASAKASKASRVEAVAASLQKRVDALQREYDSRTKVHAQKVERLEVALKGAPNAAKKTVQALLNKENRNFEKWEAMRKHDIVAMTNAVEAVRKGDMKALSTARASLMDSLKALKARSGGFLYLIQLGVSLEERDCPYCAAQCVDTCHQTGNSFAQCLTTCADAGKGF